MKIRHTIKLLTNLKRIHHVREVDRDTTIQFWPFFANGYSEYHAFQRKIEQSKLFLKTHHLKTVKQSQSKSINIIMNNHRLKWQIVQFIVYIHICFNSISSTVSIETCLNQFPNVVQLIFMHCRGKGLEFVVQDMRNEKILVKTAKLHNVAFEDFLDVMDV